MTQMADIPADRLTWCTTWYLREETLRAASDALVNFRHRLPLSQPGAAGRYRPPRDKGFLWRATFAI
jgi:Tn3 transposase DDE domain